MNEKKPTPPFFWYLVWLAVIWYSANAHWIYPLIAFSLGAVLLHNSPNGKPLQQLVQAVQQNRKVDLKQAQQMTFGIGFAVVVLALPILHMVQAQADQKRQEETSRQLAVEEQRRSAAQAEREAAEAKTAAAKAEQARLQAQTEATNARVAQEQQARRDKERAAAEAARQQRYAQQQAAAEQQQQQQAREAEQKRAEAEQTRQAAEGPYTRDQAEQLCKEKVAGQYEVKPNAVIQRGSYMEIMDHPPRNMEFGGQRVWNWEPSLEIAGAGIQIDIQCTVYPNGDVKIGNQ